MPPQNRPSASPPNHRQASRTLLTPLPSLDSLVANLSSNNPPSFTYSNNLYNLGYPHLQSPEQGGNGFPNDTLSSDPNGSCGAVKADVWIGAQLSAPPSPATIDSNTDSQVGGDYFPPSSDNSDSPQGSQDHRANLSLNFSGLPTNLHLGAGVSPASIVSSGAPFTDNMSLGVDPSDDYFHFNDMTMSASTKAMADQVNAAAQQHVAAVTAAAAAAQSAAQAGNPQVSQTLPPTPLTAPSSAASNYGYRLPASQPSSPVRGVFMSGQQSMSMNSAGRQRGATVSGMPGFDFTTGMPSGVNSVPAATPASNTPVSAVPTHFTFSAIQSPTSAQPSPSMSVPHNQQSAFLSEPNTSRNGSGLGLGEVTMDDVAQSASQSSQISRRSSASQQGGTALPGSANVASAANQSASGSSSRQTSNDTRDAVERLTLDRLTMLDNIVNQAQHARNALLNGHEERLPEALGQISNQLEIASDLGVAPQQTLRETTPGSGTNSLSPHNYSPTPTATTTNLGAGQVGQQMSVNGVPTSASLLPSLPVGQNGQQVLQQANNGATQVTGSFAPLGSMGNLSNGSAQFGQVPMPVTMPSTPVNAGGTFANAMQQHMPLVSSPLAIVPPASRSGSPKPYGTWLPDNASGASLTSGVPTANGPLAQAQAQAHAQAHAQAQAMVQAQVHAQVQAQVHAQAQAQAQAHAQAQAVQDAQAQAAKSRRPSVAEHRADGRPIVRGRSASVAKPGSLALTPSVSMPPSAWQSRQGSPVDDDDDDDDGSDDETQPRRPKRRRSSAGPDGNEMSLHSSISDDIRAQLDQIFNEFLNKVCSDLDICDSKGEKLHQVLMPKKMARLDESTDFRPFKFRIQAFTNAFHEELQSRGINEDTMSVKKVKVYLWHQPLISRFNADGKKAKSKGNHIWHVDAKKLPGGGWIFRPFERKIIGQPQTFALIGQRYEWEPKIWDPMAASASIKPTFSSPEGSLPPWLQWEDGVRLAGVPDTPQPAFHVTAIAKFIDGANQEAQLETSFTISVIRMQNPMDAAANVMYPPQAMVQQWMPGLAPDGTMDLATAQAVQAVQVAQAAQAMQAVQPMPVQGVQPGLTFAPGMPLYPQQPGFGV